MPQSAAVIVGCDRVWQDEEVRSRFDGMRGALMFWGEGGVRSGTGEREECERFLGRGRSASAYLDYHQDQSYLFFLSIYPLKPIPLPKPPPNMISTLSIS